MPPPPDPPLSSRILTALGLAVGVGCTEAKPCLEIAACLNYAETGTTPLPTGDTGESESGDTGATDTGADTGATDTGADTGATASRAARFERLAAEGVLPPDVVERLRRR